MLPYWGYLLKFRKKLKLVITIANLMIFHFSLKNRDISDAVSMYIILPNNRTGIFTLRQNFKSLTPNAFSEGVNRDVHLYLPKFAIESKLDLTYPVAKVIFITDIIMRNFRIFFILNLQKFEFCFTVVFADGY